MSTHTDTDRGFIRTAEPRDASRIAEILVFSKRTHYRQIFHDDAFSFGELQVFTIAQDLLEHPEVLGRYILFDDGFVKGLIHPEGDEIAELYVDPFFERQHIGSALMAYVLDRILVPWLWVLEKNENAIRFYQKQGFAFTGKRTWEPGTHVYKAEMRYQGPLNTVLNKIVRVTVDRPLGSFHPQYPDLYYPVNYGFIPGVPGGDGEEQDAYILGIREPVKAFTGRIIAVIRRENDSEEKWVTAPPGISFSEEEIREQTAFQEQYFRSKIITAGC